jgi:hypothetical protein
VSADGRLPGIAPVIHLADGYRDRDFRMEVAAVGGCGAATGCGAGRLRVAERDSVDAYTANI